VVSGWATSQSYEPASVNTFLLIADYYLVGYALADGYTVVYSREGINLHEED
jgi:hypothetical protein